MNVEAGTQEILDLIKGELRMLRKLDPSVADRFIRVLEIPLEEDALATIRTFRSLDLKSFDGHYQIRVGGEKRLWFVEAEGGVLLTYFGSTDHRHGEKR